jgi:nitroreductase
MPIRPTLPTPTPFGEPMAPTQESAETLQLIAQRRSTPVAALTEPGPGPQDVDILLRLAARVPDHRKLEPWRFLVFEGAAREMLADAFAKGAGGDAARPLAMRAPVVIGITSSPVDDPKQTPVWEQELSAGAVCQTLMLAANAMGWAACWITENEAYDAAVATALGLGQRERIAGFIYIGTAKANPVERARPDIAKKVTRF